MEYSKKYYLQRYSCYGTNGGTTFQKIAIFGVKRKIIFYFTVIIKMNNCLGRITLFILK